MARSKKAEARDDAAEVATEDRFDPPPEGLAVAVDSGTRPPRETSGVLSAGPFGDFPSHVREKFGDPSDYLVIYRVQLSKPTINNISNAIIGGSIHANFGQGGVITSMVLEKPTRIIYAVLRATAKLDSDYRRCVAFLGDVLVDLDPQGNVYR